MLKVINSVYWHGFITKLSMLKNIHWKSIFPAALTAALLFSFFTFFFILQADYTSTWLLYLGNVFFIFTLASFFIFFKNDANDHGTASSTIFRGMVTTFTGILMSVILVFILLLIVMPGFIESGTPSHVLQGEPPAALEGKTNGLVFKVFMAAIVLNFFGGAIISVIFSVYHHNKSLNEMHHVL